jgi:hypothetical protein
MVFYTCENCQNSYFNVSNKHVSQCIFCGKNVTETEIEDNEDISLKMLPFTISKEDATKIYNQQLKKSLISPKFFKNISFTNMKKIYIPILLYSFDNMTLATIFAENSSSSRENEDKIRINHQYNILFSTNTSFANIPVIKNKDAFIDEIEVYNFEKLLDYNPDDMQDAYIKFPSQNQDDIDDIIKEMSKNYVQNKILDNSDDYSVKAISEIKTNFVNEKISYALLPLWLFNFEYNNKRYNFHINGYTGKFNGKFPISIPKLLLSFLGTFFVSQLLFLFIRFIIFIS